MGKHRPRRGEVERIAEVVTSTIARLGRAGEALPYQVALAWPEAVGPRIAERTGVETLRDGVLTVRVNSAAWLMELTFLKQDICARLNACLDEPAVREIRLVPGAAPPAAGAPATSSAAAPSGRLPTVEEVARARSEVAGIADPALREAALALRLHLLGRDPGRR